MNRLSTADFVPAFGLNRISLVRASEELFRTFVLDALGEPGDGCVLRRETLRRSTLPGPPCPAAPLCAARPDPPVVCPSFGFDKYFKHGATILEVPVEAWAILFPGDALHEEG